MLILLCYTPTRIYKTLIQVRKAVEEYTKYVLRPEKAGSDEKEKKGNAGRAGVGNVNVDRQSANRVSAGNAGVNRPGANRVSAGNAGVNRPGANRVSAGNAGVNRQSANRVSAGNAGVNRQNPNRVSAGNTGVNRQSANRVSAGNAGVNHPGANRVSAGNAGVNHPGANRVSAGNAGVNHPGANRVSAGNAGVNRPGANRAKQGGFLSLLLKNRQLAAALIIIFAAAVVITAVISAMTSENHVKPHELETATVSDIGIPETPPSESNSDSTAPVADPTVIRAVYIDPGHGFDDPGTHNDELGVIEKDVVLNVALALRDKLEACGITVFLTHDTNTPPEDADRNKQYLFGMKKRNALANSNKDIGLFLSIHCNAYFEDESVHGPRLYYMKNDESAKALAEEISEALVDRGLEKAPITQEMSGMKSYQVLRDSDMPALLIETGFLSNEAEALAMLTEEWIERMADALNEAICDSFSNGALGVQATDK